MEQEGRWLIPAPLHSCRLGLPGHAELAADPLFDRLEDVGVLFEELFGVFAALTETLATVREPGPAFLDDAFVDGEIEEIARSGDAFAVHDVELGLAEGRRNLVFHDFHARASANHDVAILDARDAANVHAHRGVKLQRPSTRRR